MTRPSALFALFVICVFGLAPCFAQESATADASPPLSAAQLDSLTAPVALYPDALVAQILTAATYPLEVVEAAHWLEDPSNAALRGDALTAALEHEDWDLSVKSLVPFPDTLRMMERNLQWTEQIGDAFLAQQSDVMESIQRLRKLAISAGTLKSTPQQTVWNQDDEIVVEPVSPDVVYVPYYNPSVVYGAWPWADYAPSYFPPPPGVYLSGPTIVFGVGLTVIRPLWGWSYWSWPRHGLFIPPHLPHTWPLQPGPWRHDPDHRRGLPYPDRGHRPTQPGHRFPPGRPPSPRIPLPVRPPGEHPPGAAPGRPPGPAAPGHPPFPDHPRRGGEPPAHRTAPAPGAGNAGPRPQPPIRPQPPVRPQPPPQPPVRQQPPMRPQPQPPIRAPLPSRAQPPIRGQPAPSGPPRRTC